MKRRIFVFGSNLMGIHGGGAAAYARTLGAQMGVGEGLTGETYALPTCVAPGKPMAKVDVSAACDAFLRFARAHPELDFLVTAVGCGIAGFKPREIANMLRNAPDNCYFQAKLAEGFGS